MRLGISQIHTHAGDLAGVAERISVQAEAAAARGVDLLVFPITTLAGPTGVPPLHQEAFVLDASRTLAELAGRLACACLVPLPLEVDGVALRDAVLLAEGTATLIRGHARMTDVLVPLPSAVGGASVGVVFSYDDMDALVGSAVQADVLVCLSDLEFSIDDPACALGVSGDARIAMPLGPTGPWLAVVGAVGGYGHRVFLGASYVAAPDGSLVAIAPACDEALLVADVGPGSSIPSRLLRVPYDAHYYLWQALVLGIRDYVSSVGAQGVIVELDGHVASSALAVIAADALGPTRVHAFLTASGEAVRLVTRLADNLHLRLRSLGGVTCEAVDHRDLVQALLAASGRSLDALVLASVDKTALAVGTVAPGVTAASFAPLADVLRSDVVAAAHLRNAISPVFPAGLLSALDVPALGDEVLPLSDEVLLGRIDDAVASYLSGGYASQVPGMGVRAESPITSAVAARLSERATGTMPILTPFLVMSSCTLIESQLPVGFGWRPPTHLAADVAAGRLPAGGEAPRAAEHAVASANADGDGSVAPVTSDIRDVQSALRETLDLLRDLSMGDAGDWPVPFSEN